MISRWMFALVASTGCGFQVTNSGTGPDPDAGIGDVDASADATVHEVPARLIPGGGISDAPIGGLVNVYVVNALTRQPLRDAQVDVGAARGLTDATGLFVARAESLQGKQTVTVTKPGFRSEVWVGVQGANVTLHVRPSPMPMLPQANLAGTIPTTNTGAVSPPNHYKLGYVTFSASDTRLDVENQIATTNSTNLGVLPGVYTVTTRTGTVALLAGVYDVDTKGSPSGDDDTTTLVTWAIETGIAVQDGTIQTGHTLTPLAANQLQNVTVSLANPPAGYTPVAVVGIEVSPRESLGLQGILTVASPTVKAPKLSVVPNSKYRLTAALTDGQGATGLVYRRQLTAVNLAAGTWFTPPPPATADHIGASWTPPADATISGVVVRDGDIEVVAMNVFDGSVAAMYPTRIVLPQSTTLTVQPTAVRATFDAKSFSFDTDYAKVDGLAVGKRTAVN